MHCSFKVWTLWYTRLSHKGYWICPHYKIDIIFTGEIKKRFLLQGDRHDIFHHFVSENEAYIRNSFSYVVYDHPISYKIILRPWINYIMCSHVNVPLIVFTERKFKCIALYESMVPENCCEAERLTNCIGMGTILCTKTTLGNHTKLLTFPWNISTIEKKLDTTNRILFRFYCRQISIARCIYRYPTRIFISYHEVESSFQIPQNTFTNVEDNN